MKLIIDIPINKEERVKTAYEKTYNYQDLVEDPNNSELMIDNPETIEEFVKRKLIEKLEEETSRYELNIEKKTLHKNFQRIDLKS